MSVPTDEWHMTTAQALRLPRATSYDAGRGPRWLMVQGGGGRLEVAGQAHDLVAGDAVLVGPRLEAVLTAAADTVLTVSDLALVRATRPLPAVLVVRGFAERQRGVAELVRICPMSACLPALMSASYANLIGAAMTTLWLEAEGPTGADAVLSDPAVTAVVAAVTDRPGEPWTVERMAGLVHLSRSALGERFRRELHRSPAEVLREARMQEARRLLRSGAPGVVQVDQVARAVGYGSAAAFSRAFASHHGTSPQTWRAGPASGPRDLRGPHRGEDGTRRERQAGPQHQSRHDSVPVDERAS